VKKVNIYGYNIHLREGRHHQHIKFTKIEHKPKRKVVKERRPRQEATFSVREWTSSGSSSSSSSDESRKNFTTRFGEVTTQIDPASEQHVQNPAITAPRLLRLSTGVARPTSPRRLILDCESKNTSNNKEECNTIADVWLNSRVGVSQTEATAKLLLKD
jgi:hypothetical protein